MNERSAFVADRVFGDAEEMTVRSTGLFGIRRGVALAGLHTYPDRVLPVVRSVLRHLHVDPAGPPVTLFRAEPDGRFEVTAAYPVARPPVMGLPFVAARLPAGRAVQVLHLGPRQTLLFAYDRLSEWLTVHHVLSVPLMWEEYLVGPDQAADPAAWRTRIVVPLPGPAA